MTHRLRRFLFATIWGIGNGFLRLAFQFLVEEPEEPEPKPNGGSFFTGGTTTCNTTAFSMEWDYT